MKKTKSLPNSSFLSPKSGGVSIKRALPRLLSLVVFISSLCLTIYHWSFDLLLLTILSLFNVHINYKDEYE